MSTVFESLCNVAGRLFTRERPKQRRVELLLGSDRSVGCTPNERAIERRVGMTAKHVSMLVQGFAALPVDLSVLVLRGAGERAGCPDGDYLRAGADIVTEDQLPCLDGPDVVHALKEPCPYEASIQSSFLRIGAAHAGDFSPASGLARLIEHGGVAVFDGSHIGSEFRKPIRSCMSVFAGRIGAQWIGEHLSNHGLRGDIVIIGAGHAGRSAAYELLIRDIESGQNRIGKIRLFDEAIGSRLAAIRALVTSPTDAWIRSSGIPVTRLADRISLAPIGGGLDAPELVRGLDGAAAVLIAAARPGSSAPRVASVGRLAQRMQSGALVVDISIDEKGGVEHSGIKPDWNHTEIITHLTDVLEDAGLTYRAVSNMPRACSADASEAHGDAVLPYVAALLLLSARDGGPERVAQRLSQQTIRPDNADPRNVLSEDVLAALEQDLRNGMIVYPRGNGQARRTVIEDAVGGGPEVAAMLLADHRPFEIGISFGGGGTGRSKTERLLDMLPREVRDCLSALSGQEVRIALVSHPGIDGGGPHELARALGVDDSRVVKGQQFGDLPDGTCLAICSGADDLVLERLRVAIRANPQDHGRVTALLLGTDCIKAALVDRRLLENEHVWTPVGNRGFCVSIPSRLLTELGGTSADLCSPSIIHAERERIQTLVACMSDALRHSNDTALEGALGSLSEIFAAVPVHVHGTLEDDAIGSDPDRSDPKAAPPIRSTLRLPPLPTSSK